MAASGWADEAKSNRGPSVRRRYVTRAQTLLEDRTFRDALSDIRSEWDRTYPTYSIGRPAMFPEPTVPTINSTHAAPPQLLAAFARAKADRRYDRDEEPVWGALDSWKRFVNAECRRWWPARFFPNYIGWGGHPGSLFLSSCIVYDERTVPTTLIFENHYVPEHHPFDPTDDDSNPVVIGLRARCEALEQALRDALTDSGDAAEKAINQAKSKGFWVQLEVEDRDPVQYASGYIVNGWWYVPLLPEMTTSDWDAMRTEAIATVRRVYGDDPVRSHILRLSDDRVPASQIARLLGVSERHVYNVLREHREATEQ